MNVVIILTVCLALTSCTHTLFAQSTPLERDIGTPKPQTPLWEIERDLIIMFDNTEDRVTLAHSVLQTSLNGSNGLTTQQRSDGLRIAGHTLWKEGQYEDVIVAFDALTQLDVPDSTTVSAARMLGQAAYMLRRWEVAADAYQLCFTLAKQISDASGFPDTNLLTIVAYIDAEAELGNIDSALALVDEVIENLQYFPLNGVTRPATLERGGRIAMENGLSSRAEGYLSTLLDEYPGHGLEWPGIRVDLQLMLLQAEGYTVKSDAMENDDPEAWALAMGIIMDEAYYGMPTWAGLVQKISEMLDNHDTHLRANKLREWGVQMIDERMDTFATNDPLMPLYQISSDTWKFNLLYDAQWTYRKMKQWDKYRQTLERIVTEVPNTNPSFTQIAQQHLDRMQQSP